MNSSNSFVLGIIIVFMVALFFTTEPAIVIVTLVFTALYMIAKKLGVLRVYKRDFVRLFLSYICISFIVIGIFSFIYLGLFLSESFNLSEDELNEITSLSESNSSMKEAYEYVDSLVSFKNLNYDNINNSKLMYLDFLYFSSITFFTIGFGDILVSGTGRLLVIIESCIGVGFTAIYIYLAMNIVSNTYSKKDILDYKLSRGWEIINYVKQKNDYRIVMLSKLGDIEEINCSGNITFQNYLDALSSDWLKQSIRAMNIDDLTTFRLFELYYEQTVKLLRLNVSAKSIKNLVGEEREINKYKEVIDSIKNEIYNIHQSEDLNNSVQLGCLKAALYDIFTKLNESDNSK